VKVALVGDSHAAQWLRPILAVADRRGWKLRTYFKSGCPMTMVPPTSTERFGSACADWNADVRRHLARDGYSAVFVSGFSGLPYPSARGETSVQAAARGFAGAWRQVVRSGVQVISIRDNPLPLSGGQSDTPSCIEDAHSPAQVAACGTWRAASLKADPQTLAAKDVPVLSVDLTRYFCPRERCPAVIGNVLVYEVQGHITGTYARTLGPILGRKLQSLRITKHPAEQG
jgi:hypothetical protein